MAITTFCIIAAIGAAIGASIVASSASSFREIWGSLPSPRQDGQPLLLHYGNTLLGNMTWGLLRASILFMVCALIIETGRILRKQSFAHTSIAVALCCVIALDIATSVGRYIKVRDMSSFAEKNEVLRTVESTRRPFRVALFQSELAGSGSSDQACEMLMSTASTYEIDLVRSPYNTYFPYLELARTLGTDGIGIRFWQLTSSDYVFGPIQLVSRLGGKPDFRFISAFDIVPDGKGLYTWRKNPEGKGRYVLLKYGKALPRALVYHDWMSVETNNWKAHLADPSLDPHKTVVVEGSVPGTPSRGEPSPVSTLNYSPNTVAISLTVTNEGVLLLNDIYDAGWKVLVNDHPAPLLRCNGVMRGVKVDAGTHTVTMHYAGPLVFPVRLQIVTMFLMGMLALVLMVRRTLARAAPHVMGPPK
ncbi:MAG: YfhO family protein [bacterium]